jgi:PAS domain S-box-containing protein
VALDPAVVVVRRDGRFLDANPPALELFGVTLDELRRAQPGQFSARPSDPQADEAFRRQWDAAGNPDVGGEATIVRPDGEQRRVRFVITPRARDELAVVLEPVPAPTADPSVVFTASGVLAEWRAAERRLEAVPADSPEWAAAKTQVEALRERYQRIFEARRGGEPERR